MAVAVDAAELRKPRVLVVDDDPGVHEMILYALRDRGFDAEGVRDGLQALARLQHGAFNVVLTDLRMPRLDGLALLREIKRMERSIPVVVYSSAVDSATEVLLRRSGAFRVATKGGRLADLVPSVEEACRVSEHPPARCA